VIGHRPTEKRGGIYGHCKPHRGVRAVANDIEVRPKLGRTDADIARDVVRSLELRSTVPDNVQATVHHGHVTLTGETMWEFQRRGRGEGGPSHPRRAWSRQPDQPDPDSCRPRRSPPNPRSIPSQCRSRRASRDGACAGDVVTLSGQVGTWLQRDIAERAAADAPGIRRVENLITVVPPVEEEEIC
jgi:BON domain